MSCMKHYNEFTFVLRRSEISLWPLVTFQKKNDFLFSMLYKMYIIMYLASYYIFISYCFKSINNYYHYWLVILQNINIQIDNKTFETFERFEFLGTNLAKQNSFHDEIKMRLKSGNVWCHSVQNFCLPVCYKKRNY